MVRFLVSLAAAACASAAAAQSPVYDNIPPVLAGNYPSLGYQATQTAEFGDRVTFGGTGRHLRAVTVTMSSWARSEDYGNAVSFVHPLTMNIYQAGTGLNHGPLIATVTTNATIPYRPTGWGFNGIACNVTFDFSSLNVTLPNSIVYGLAYNTQTWGSAPIGVDGPYNSLNFALNTAPGGGVTAGSNDDLDDVFWSTSTAGWYTDSGAGGVGFLRQDTAWTGYTPMAQFDVADLSLVPVSSCVNNNTVTVNINMGAQNTPVVGGQFFLQYDTSRLAFVSASPGPAPFTLPIFQSTGPGTIDYAVGVPGGGPGTTSASTMATLTFNWIAADECATPTGLVSFRPHSPATRLSDNLGNPIAPALVDLPSIRVDDTAPVITCPPNISVNADAGGCSATLSYNEPFNVAPTLSNSPAPGVYYVDRYPPAGFTSAPGPAGHASALKHSISSADSISNRPGPYQSGFYNTQGRDLDVNLAVGQTLGIDLYIDPSWLTGDLRRADLWSVGVDHTNAVVDYGIIGFASTNPANDTVPPGSTDPDPAQTGGVPRWRVYSDSNVGLWTTVGPVPTAGWHRLEIALGATTKTYKLDGVPVLTMTNYGSVRISSALIQAYNFGTLVPPVPGPSYDVYWDNLTVGPQGPVATDNCSVGVSYVRSDNALLTLADPFPAGNTTVTWTATDSCGNSSSCMQTVHVNNLNTFDVTVRLNGHYDGPFTRCITFNFGPGCPGVVVDRLMSFVPYDSGGDHWTEATATFTDIPCGSYNCLSARDKRHTLRRTADPLHFGISGTHYEATFIGTDMLTSGNDNDDDVIDILDFGAFVGQFGVNYGTPDTTCSTPFPHADFSGDALVSTGDFSFIQVNFLQVRDPDCCGGLLVAPRTRVAIGELLSGGNSGLIVADLNHDGWLDTMDMVAFSTVGGLPCRADWNSDGAITPADVSQFVNTWFAGLTGNDPRADVDGNGAIQPADISSFVNTWFASLGTGC